MDCDIVKYMVSYSQPREFKISKLFEHKTIAVINIGCRVPVTDISKNKWCTYIHFGVIINNM